MTAAVLPARISGQRNSCLRELAAGSHAHQTQRDPGTDPQREKLLAIIEKIAMTEEDIEETENVTIKIYKIYNMHFAKVLYMFIVV